MQLDDVYRWIPGLLAAAALEEIVFRAGLQEALLRQGWQPARAESVAGLGFAVAHGLARSWLLAAAVVPAACLLGRLYTRRRDVAPCIALHGGLNLAWVALVGSVPASSLTTWLGLPR